MKKIKTGTDFSGVGAFDQALMKLGISQDKKFACDKDKYARKTYILNYGCPDYFPEDVHEREIPEEPLDLYMTSPPCQAFSLSGKRLGKIDKRGILFFNSLEFIGVNKPKRFIFENVKGLLSNDKNKNSDAQYGSTFQEWLNLLGGKSVNGNVTIFPYQDSVPYHIYHNVLNATDFTVPQNRERVFIVGIRDDRDNNFIWPKTTPLKKRLRDVLEAEVHEKYFLSQKIIDGFLNHANRHSGKGNGFGFDVADLNCPAKAIMSPQKMHPTDNYVEVSKERISGYFENDNVIGAHRGDKKRSGIIEHVYHKENGVCQTIISAHVPKVIQINNSKESGGKQPYQQNRIYDSEGIAPALCAGQEIWCGNIVILKKLNKIRIRRLTPRECFRLMGFPDSFVWNVSDSQAYKQAGNSIVVDVLAAIIKQLNL